MCLPGWPYLPRLRLTCTDTQETPFRCPHCHQRYQRADVLRRHVKRFCQGTARVIQDTTPPPRKHRIKVACDLCHEKKLKCTGTFPCRTCEQQGRLCTAARVANSNRNGTTQVPPSAGVSSDISSGAVFPEVQASTGVTETRPGSLNARVHFQGMHRDGGDTFIYGGTGTRDMTQHMMAHPALDGSVHDSSAGVFGNGNVTSLDATTPLAMYSQGHPSISASFEPLFQAMDVMIQQEDATQFTHQIEQSTLTTDTTPSRPPINYDFMSLWDEGSYDDLWQSPSHVSSNIFSLLYDLIFVVL